jgi:cytochrome c-type biogenesis protein CcmE
MTHRALKLGIAGVILAGAVTYLAVAGMQKGWVYTLGVDQYVTEEAQHGKRLRLCGTVMDEDLQVQKAQLVANFYIRGQEKKLRVTYKGVVPDLFKAGSEVVIEGKEDSAGVFQSDLLMTKCASKYEDMAKSSTMANTQPTTAGGAGGASNGTEMGVKP